MKILSFQSQNQIQIQNHALATGQSGDALFVYNRAAGCYWYNTKLQAGAAVRQLYYVAGWLAGQALHNRTTLGIKLAALLWQKVLEGNNFKASNP